MMPWMLLLLYGFYFLFLIGFLVFSGVGLFHLSEYGHENDFCRPMIYIYLGVAGFIMMCTFVLLVTFAS